jgi:hypothetical protein
MRCWQAGQGGGGAMRPDWETIKIYTMLAVNRAKYEQHADLREELLATGHAPLAGGPSTQWMRGGLNHKWQYWNGLIQMLIRHELQQQQQQQKEEERKEQELQEQGGQQQQEEGGQEAAKKTAEAAPVPTDSRSEMARELRAQQAADIVRQLDEYARLG